jgi:beta-glucanase (GH16 family)
MKKLLTISLGAYASVSLLSGCGGASSPSSASANSQKGTMSVKVIWPLPSSKVIPLASQSISVVLKDSAGHVDSQGLIVKPATSWTSGQLAPGSYSIAASAFPNVNGSGDMQASGAGTVAVTSGQNTPASVTMGSTVTKVTVSSPPPMLLAGSTDQLTASCTDTNGNIVLEDPSTISWSSTNNTLATVNGGLVTGAGSGSVSFSATFTEVEPALAQSPVVSNSVSSVAYANSPYVPIGYSLAWSDEFDGATGSKPNSTNWTYDLGAGGWGNSEQETYTNTNATIVADSSATDGLALDIKATTDGTNYYSSRIKTEGLQSFTYGYIECRAKVPPGGANYQGYWPAFWMLGSDITSVNWPTCGEVDVMEHLNGSAPDISYQTAHANTSTGSEWSVGYNYAASSDLGAGYHLYAVLWQQNSITFYTDGVQDGSPITSANIGSGNVWEFSQPQFIILNMAVGGNWPGNITSSTQFPADYMIDYVRVYQQ